MAFYDNGSSQWSAPGRQSSWEQPPPPSRSGASSTVQQAEPTAFSSQFEEVDRAADNLMKSGKMFGAAGASNSGAPRRDSMPSMAGRGYNDFSEAPTTPRTPSGHRLPGGDPRMGGPQRHHSVSEYDGSRSHSASNVQGYYANQRFGPRPNEADQMMQAKRRMAAQRERELRNYHQEQQYNRNVSGGKSDRSLSPNAMSEDERRELIARQHRALYGDNSTLYTNDGQRTSSQDARVASATAGTRSPHGFDPFGTQTQSGNSDGSVQMPPRDQMPSKDAAAGAQRSRANSTSSPSSNPTTSFTLYDNAQQSSRTSNSSPGGSPPRQGGPKSSANTGVAPIGTRPTQAQGPSNKRSTTPLPSPLSFGFSASEQQKNNTINTNTSNNNNERSTSTSSNPPSSVADKGVGLGWGSNSGVWGSSKNTLGVQASVWG